MVRITPQNVRGGPGFGEQRLAIDSGLRSRRFSFVTSGFRSDHQVSNPGSSGNPTNIGGSWRCIRQADGIDAFTSDADWRTLGSADVPGATTTGWRTNRMPFPSTVCVSILFAGLNAANTLKVQLMVKGKDQFGRPLTEVSPWIPIHRQDMVLFNVAYSGFFADYQTARIFMARVFSEVSSVSYRSTGAAPGAASVNVGQHFTFNSQLTQAMVADPIVSLNFSHIEQFYFPANQGIGIGTVLAQESGTTVNRFPELRVTVWNGSAGPQNIAYLRGYEDIALWDDETVNTPGTYYTRGGLYMGFTPINQWVPLIGASSKDQDLITLQTGSPVPYSSWDPEPLKFRVDHSNIADNTASAAARQSFQRLHQVFASDDSTPFEFYDPNDWDPNTSTKFINPKTLHWSVEVFTLAGAKTPTMSQSAPVRS